MTVDLSPSEPSTGNEIEFDSLGRRLPRNRCHAHKKNGAQCKSAAIPGGRVCRKHGGSAPQTIAKARVRLQMQTEKAADELILMAMDRGLDYKRPDVRLAALREVLDRGGVGVKEEIDINIDPKPFEKLLEKIGGIANMTREESRRARDENTIDAEVVSAPEVEGTGNGLSAADQADRGDADDREISGFERITKPAKADG